MKATIETQPLETTNNIFSRLKKGKVNGRIALALGTKARKPIAPGQTAACFKPATFAELLSGNKERTQDYFHTVTAITVKALLSVVNMGRVVGRSSSGSLNVT